MQGTLRGEREFAGERQKRAIAVLILALPLLLALASGASAALICQDCHGLHHATADAPQQCGNTSTCGTSCHPGKLDTILHPSGAGTPMADISTPAGTAAACSTCHVPPATAAAHPYRINTLPGTISDYPGVEQACGQCHGGGTDSAGNPPRTGVVYLAGNQLAVAAQNIHSNHALDNADCTLCHGTNGIPPSTSLINHPTGPGTPGSGAAACKTCHVANGTLHRKAAISVQSVCGPCHGDAGTAHKFTGFADNPLNTLASGMHTRANPGTTCSVCHSAVASSHLTNSVAHAVTHTDNATCTICHTRAGVRPLPETMTACAGCHPQTLASMNHPGGGVGFPNSCADCHPTPGVVPQTDAGICDRCHTVDVTAGRLPQIHFASSNPATGGAVPDGSLIGGAVTVRDALRALQIAAGLVAPTADDLAHGDVAPLVNGKPQPDGKIDIRDAVVILRRSVGLISW